MRSPQQCFGGFPIWEATAKTCEWNAALTRLWCKLPRMFLRVFTTDPSSYRLMPASEVQQDTSVSASGSHFILSAEPCSAEDCRLKFYHPGRTPDAAQTKSNKLPKSHYSHCILPQRIGGVDNSDVLSLATTNCFHERPLRQQLHSLSTVDSAEN